MSVIERCRTCRQRLKIPDARIGDGKPIRCPVCGADVFAAPLPQGVEDMPKQSGAVITAQPVPLQRFPDLREEIASPPPEFTTAPITPARAVSPSAIPPRLPDPEPRKPSIGTGLLILGAITLLFSCYMGGLLFSRSGPSKDSKRSISNPDRSTDGSRQSAREDPYSPDCAIIRTWLRRNYGDIEVVSWGKRTIHRSAALGDSVTLTARFRVAGDTRSKRGLFIIGPGDIVESATISD